MSERQTGARVVALFSVISVELFLAPFGVGQGATGGALEIRNVWASPNAIKVEDTPGSFRRWTFRRLISAAALAFAGALTGSGSALGGRRATLRLLGEHPNGSGQTRCRSEYQAVVHISPTARLRSG